MSQPDDRSPDARRQDEARRILDRADRDSAPMMESALQRSGDFFTARGESDDPAEIWGKRVGRILAVVAAIGCLVWLYLTYGR
ncbi:hypothetical protein [Phreatobacter oligotrophus]|uniref:Uncharacterized protein n=1 Tax=Phreatobacter oligotrophus TaxID=1122261 RepID=A0A2T4YYC9_9HYPH|nr:hypothetical protein [Phreatobacter oligotrophus]PTM51758.1 hypothetical protein C8P69_10945 [Phreatobacter oligotrophus]